MYGKLISFGEVNKKLLLPFLLALADIIFIILNKYLTDNENNSIINYYSLAIGQLAIRLIPYFIKISDKDESNEKVAKQKKCKDFSILCGLYLLAESIKAGRVVLSLKTTDVTTYDYIETNLFPTTQFIILSLEMIFLVLISRCLLKYKYYKHHIIAIIIMAICGLISDLLFITSDQYNKSFFTDKFIRIINSAVDALYLCYEKYMMEILYYPYWSIAFIPGIFTFFLATTLFFIILKNPDKENASDHLISGFYTYFTKYDLGIVITKAILLFILYIILCPLNILNLFYFSPNLILIIFQIATIVDNFLQNPIRASYCIPFYIFQFLALMIHLEIIELNFWGLNDNTKKNINMRGLDDILGEGRDSTAGLNSIDINPDYKINKNEMEMNEQIYNDSDDNNKDENKGE